MFSPSEKALDLKNKFRYNRLLSTPLIDGIWSILEPADIQNHAPQLCWISKSELGLVWMAGGREGTSGMRIVFSSLKQAARGWAKPTEISQDCQRSEQNPLLFITRSNNQKKKVHLIHTAQDVRNNSEKYHEKSTFSMQWTAKLRTQSRSSLTARWNKSQDLLDSPAFCRNPPHQRDDGMWLLPIYRSLEAGGSFGHDYSELLLLDNEGNATDQLIPIPESIGRVHGSIVTSSNGDKLLQFFRSRQADFIYRSVGTLDGLNWSVPEAIDLPNNNSSIQALRLKSGRLAMIFNRFSLYRPYEQPSWGEAIWPRIRWPLSVALSSDDGETWPWIKDLDHGDGYAGDFNWFMNGQLAYPTILEGFPGELHIAYSWGGREAIRYLCLFEEQILGKIS